MKTSLKLSALVLVSFALAGAVLAENQAPATAGAPFVTSEVVAFDPFPEPGDVVADAVAWLVATDDGLTAIVTTTELPPGDAVTMWWVVFNDPEACEAHPAPCGMNDIGVEEVAAEVTYAAGTVIDDAGNGTFVGYHPLGHTEQAWFGHGLRNPLGAEVHLVMRTHGPVIEDRLDAMIGTFRDGCHNVEEDHPAYDDGEPGPNECHDLQFAILQQH